MYTKINKIVCTKINKNTQTPSTHYVLHNKKKHEINKRNKNSEKYSDLFLLIINSKPYCFAARKSRQTIYFRGCKNNTYM